MRGALLPSLKQAFTVSPSLLGFVATAGTLGFMLAVLVSGMVAGRIDLHQVLFGSVSVVAVSVFFMGVAPIFLVYLLTLFVRGVALVLSGRLTVLCLATSIRMVVVGFTTSTH